MPLANGVVEVKYGTPQHKRLMKEITSRLKLSRDALDKRTTEWANNEDLFMAYMPAKDADAARKLDRKNGVPSFTTVAVPYSYATLLAAHTYYTSVFLSRSPVFQVTGRHGESQNSEMAVESLLDYQLMSGNNLVPFYGWLLDPGKYGIGWLGQYWDKEEVTVVSYQDIPETRFGFKTGKIIREAVEETVVGYNGLRYFNVRPQDMFIDPRLPASQFQQGEFCARYTELGMHKVRAREVAGQYYNIEVAKKTSTNAKDRDRGSPRTMLPNEDTNETSWQASDRDPMYLGLHEFHWEIVPRDYGLGRSEKPQKWVFTVSGESVIISAQPLGLLSNRFPFNCLEHEVDSYSLWKRGLLEVMDPLNKTIEWLFNSHFYNVRAMLNNQLVVDPSRIVMKDFENPEPGRLLRLKPIAYGSDTRTAVSQLAVGDITRSHVNDTQLVAELLQRVSGVNDTVMGMMEGGRKTATEIRQSTTFGINRLKTNCEYFSAMGFGPLTQQAIQTTQQMYDMERKFRIVGNAAQWADRFVNVTPGDIAGFYDFVPVDGTLPVDRFAQANLWKELLMNVQALPQLQNGYDVPKIFSFVAQLAGLKNIDQFRVQTMDNAGLQQQVQAGNMVPVGEVANLNEPGQISGLGPTG